MKLHTLFAVFGVFAGCSVDEKEPSLPAFDADAPYVHILTPERGAVAGEVTHLVVTGTAIDDTGAVESVTVNGVVATLAPDRTWSVVVPVAPGTNLLHAIATDARHNEGTETRAVVVGPMVELAGHVAGGLRTSLSAQAIGTLGRDTATFIENGGLMTAVQGMNPVVNVGGGPDCTYAQAAITSLTVGDADVQTQPTTGGISVATVLDNVRIDMRLSWAIGCTETSRDVVLTAQRVTVQGLLAIDVVARKLDIQLENRNVQVTGFEMQLPDVPEEITQMLALDSAASVSLGLVIERVVVPLVERSLAPLDATRTIERVGMQIDVDVAPAQIAFTSEGGTLTLDTSLRARGDSGSFVFVPTPVPAVDTTHGFALAIADDAANQLLASLWSAKAFDTTVDFALGSYGSIGELYDSAKLQLVAPPHVDATGAPLQLTIGDWIATFERDGAPAMTVALHARSALYAVERDDGTLRVDLTTPSVDVDIVDAHGHVITKAEYQAIRSFAFERIHTLGAAALESIPLPVLGDAMLTSSWLSSQSGYLLLDGNVQ